MAFRKIILILAFCLQGCTAERYTPAGIWADEETSEFMEDWFSGHLGAMEEPRLWRLAETDPGARVYRLLVLPTFDHPFAVRLSIDAAGEAEWRAVVLDGQGGYDPGRISQRTRGRLDGAGTGAVLGQIETLDFWNLETDLDAVIKWTARDGPGPGQTTEEITICFDGTQFVLEGVEGGRYHLSTHSCDGPLEDLAAAFFDLASLDPDVIKY